LLGGSQGAHSIIIVEAQEVRHRGGAAQGSVALETVIQRHNELLDDIKHLIAAAIPNLINFCSLTALAL
jgi:hypothetical protein